MGYLKKLNEFTFDYLPFGDKILERGEKLLGIESAEAPKLSKRHQKRRIETAKRIQEAVKEKQIDPSFAEKADHMMIDARKQLAKAKKNSAEENFESREYLYEQIGKMEGIIDTVVPGSGAILSPIGYVAQLKHLSQYAQEVPLIETAKKVSMIAGTTAVGVLIAPYLTTTVIAIAGATAYGAAIAADKLMPEKK